MGTSGNTFRAQCIDKVRRIKALGIDPYPSTSRRTHMAADVHERFDELEGQVVTVAGRMMSRRGHGQLVFADVQDQSGRIQLMVASENLRPTSPEQGTLGFDDVAQLVDIGDIVEAEGTVTRTRRGEDSVRVNGFRLLSKSLQPLPDKWHGVSDEEVLARKRYLDLIMNPAKRERFVMVSDILLGVRTFLNEHDFVEFNTPILQPLYGGGRAQPFRTHVNAIDSDYYLAISHELYLKRLIIAGFERVYTIGRYFRNEGIDKTHNPEFSMLETMTAFEGYEFNMDLTEALYKHLAAEVVGKKALSVRGQPVNLMGEWPRQSMLDLVHRRCGIDFRSVSDPDVANAALADNRLRPQPTVGHALTSLFEEVVAPELIQPTIVYGYPVEVSPLAKAMVGDPRFVERFELYVGGIEQGDNWSELNDPDELGRRFQAEQERRGAAEDAEAHPVDHEFLEAMEYGMPPTTGVGPGIERLAMLLTEADSIADVIFFPLLRPLAPPEAAKPPAIQ
ncbi:MAG TPA: lysine--tRNA ligase [Acidimicrobiales bacterium]|nr:lysine--tRNA ligase [Acidimicrobiales bacterium]